ncbi:MAG: ABC transporter ATP-binding protein [Anaerolineaceae bacterium]
MSNILELNNVKKSFTGFSLQNVSFALPTGFIMGFIGPNGAGKTTTIKLILNMLSLEGGSIKVFGKDHFICEQEIKEKIGVVMDQPFYVDEWTLLEVEKSLSPFYQKWNAAKYNTLLKEFHLDAQKKVKALSHGMKMKLMIAVALSHEADLLILDEPTSGLDAVTRNELMDILSTFMTDENKGILFSTQITSDLEKIADYITFINYGKILYSGTKDDLLEKYCIVKGGNGALNAEQKEHVIGYHEHRVGFDGLIDRTLLKALPKSVVTEPSNLDEIIFRFNLGEEQR